MEYNPRRPADLPTGLRKHSKLAGQLLSRVRFHTRQGWFRPCHHPQEATNSVDALARLAGYLLAPDDADEFRQRVRDNWQQVEEDLRSPSRQRDLADAEWELEATLSGFEGSLADLRQMMLSDVEMTLEELRSSVVELLPVGLQPAFFLGEVLDEAFCPANVCRLMDAELAPDQRAVHGR